VEPALSSPPPVTATIRPSPGCRRALHRCPDSESTGCPLASALFDIVKHVTPGAAALASGSACRAPTRARRQLRMLDPLFAKLCYA